MGTIRITQDSTGQVTILWTTNYDNEALNAHQRWMAKVILTQNSANQVSAKIWFVQYTDKVNPGSANEFRRYYATYDDATGAITEDEGGYYSGGEPYHNYTSIERSGDVAKVANNFSWTDGDNRRNQSLVVAWANDSLGGVAGLHDNDTQDSTPAWLTTEFYDKNGFMVQNSWGSESVSTAFLDWYVKTTGNINLAAAPFGLGSAPGSVTVTYSSGTAASSVGSTSYSGTVSGVYFKAAGGSWSSGDAAYYPDGASGNTVTYRKAYTVPSAVTIEGKNYYLDKQFPLLYLSLAKSGYALWAEDDSANRQKDVSYEYFDENGVPHAGTYDWVPKIRWLDSNSTGTQGTFDSGIDIRLTNIWPNQYCIWDGVKWRLQNAYIVSSSENAPPNFTFTQSDLVRTVENNLTALYSVKITEVGVFLTITFPGVSEFPNP